MKTNFKKCIVLAMSTVMCLGFFPSVSNAISVETTDKVYEGFENGNAALPITLIGRYNSGVMNEDGGSSEIVSYSKLNGFAYVVNGTKGTLDSINLNVLNNSSALQNLEGVEINVKQMIETSLGITYGDMTSVSVSKDGSKLAVSIQEADYSKNGAVAVFDVQSDGSLKFSTSFITGVQPDMVTFSEDGRYVLSADEGEPRMGYLDPNAVDPKGSVTVHNMETSETRNIDFSQFDNERETLINNNVIIKKNTLPSVDFEPEYISTTGKYAFVALQEANAYAVLDLTSLDSQSPWVSVNSFGFKDHSVAAIDLNKEDKAYASNTYENLMGILMPDGIQAVNISGEEYLLISEEGDARSWPVETEAETNENESKTSPTGNIVVEGKVVWFDQTDYDGLDETKDYLFGGRGFAIYKNINGNLERIYESGDDFERLTAGYIPENFNASNDKTSIDNRSGKKGPEPENIVTGVVDGRTYAFIGLERIGGIMVYDITNPAQTSFVNYINSRDFSTGVKNDVAPEGLDFVSAEDSPTGKPLVLASFEVSGTVGVFSLSEKIEEKVTVESLQEKYGTANILQEKVAPSLDYAWTIRFNTDLDSATVNGSNIKIVDQYGEECAFITPVVEDGNTVKLNNTSSFEGESEYYIIVTKDVKSVENSGLEKPVIMKFTSSAK